MIPPEKLETYKRGAEARELRRLREAIRRREMAWRVARRAARLLKEQFGAVRVVVFGSLAHGAWFHSESDIDLAVAGIAPELFWRAWCALDRVSDGFEINLVALEGTSESLRQEIEVRGVEV
jgi:predicted nucleotidyltransferase